PRHPRSTLVPYTTLFRSRQHASDARGSIVFLTSGQGLGPMPGEVAYATAKAALAGITVTIADQLADDGIRVNTVNPGPVDTGMGDRKSTRLNSSHVSISY